MRLFIFAVMCVGLNQSAFASDVCVRALTAQDLQAKPRFLGISRSTLPNGIPIPDHPTIRIGTVPENFRNIQGEEWVSMILRLPDEPWRSNYSIDGVENATQGDPRLPLAVLGPELARFFGFVMPTEESILVPSVRRINQAIARLNAHLPPDERIWIRFYEQTQGLQVGYLENIVLPDGYLGIPISTDSAMMAVHDIVFHVPTILASAGFVRRLIRYHQTIEVVEKRVEVKNPAAIEARMTAYDVWSALPGVVALGIFERRRSNEDLSEHIDFELLALDGRSEVPADRFEQIDRTSIESGDMRLAVQVMAMQGVTHQEFEELNLDLRRIQPAIPHSTKEFYKEMMARRVRLRELARQVHQRELH